MSLKTAIDRDPHHSPAMLMQKPAISQAYSDRERAHSETENWLSLLSDWQGKINIEPL